MKRLLPLAALLLAAGCNNAISPVAPPPKDQDPAAAAAEARLGEGGVVKLNSENTKITFVGTKPNGKHVGGFKTVTGTIQMNSFGPGERAPTARIGKIKAEIDVESLYSDDPKLTNHLKQPDFFDAKQFPKATFESTKIEGVKEKPDDVLVTGDLTLHGQKKSITFPATITQEKGTFALTGDFKIKRKEFGISFDKAPVDDEVSVRVVVGKPPADKK